MSTFHQSGPDEVRIKRGLVTLLLFFLTVFTAAYTIRTGNRVFMAGVIAIPFALILMNKPKVAFALAVIMAPVGFKVYQQVDIGFIFRLIVCATFIFGFVMGKKPWRGQRLAEQKPLLILVGVIVILMVVRGTGLRILGSRTWGGSVYIDLFSAIFFFLFVNGLRLPTKYIKWMMWCVVAAMGMNGFLSYFGWSADAAAGTYQSYRISWLLPVSMALLVFGFITFSRRHRILSFGLWGAALMAMAATGFRSKLVGMIMVVGIYFYFKAKNKKGYILAGLICGGFLWGGVVALSPLMPSGIQRSVSFVPGATVDAKTAMDAAGSIDWRVEIWGYALKRAPQYLLIGRGGTFDVGDAVKEWGVEAVNSPWMAFQTHVYHSGPIELLIDYGIIGLIAVVWLHILVCKRLWRLSQQLAPIDTSVSRYLSYICASQMWLVVAFYLVFGYMAGMSNWLAQSAIIMVLANNVLEEQAQNREPKQVNG